MAGQTAKSKTGTTTQNELRPPLSGLLDMSRFFYEVALSTQCPQPLLHEGKNSKHYPGIKPKDGSRGVRWGRLPPPNEITRYRLF
jgi:hypothetical protein